MMSDIDTLKSELLAAHPYRIEMHAHTSPVSGCSQIPPAELIERYSAFGYNAICVTNHFTPAALSREREEWIDFYMSDYLAAAEAGKKAGIRVLLGMEIRFAGLMNDYLVYGVDEDFLRTAWDYLGTDIGTFYRDCKSPRNVIVQAHPKRDGMSLADGAFLDGVEVFNMHPGHNSRISAAARHAAGIGGLRLGGTDFHHPGHEAQIALLSPSLPTDSFDLARILQERDYLFDLSGSIILP